MNSKKYVRPRDRKLDYLVIGGWSYSSGPSDPYIALMRGNLYSEEMVRVLRNYPRGTSHAFVKAEAESLAKELGVMLGRNFPADVWAGKSEEK